MTSSYIDNIPDDLLQNILSRLSVKSLLRFKSVCKHCCSLIQDPDPAFVKMHLERFSKDIFIYNNQSHLHKIDQQGILDSENLCRMDYDDPLMDYFATHCNGLYASPSYDGYCILNPSTRESIPLPHTSVEFTPLSVAIGFDPSRNKYKVVVIYSQRARDDQSDTEEELPVECHVITLGTSSWRTISSKPIIRAPINHHPRRDVNGTLYWSAADGKDIISFDLKNEQFGVILQPKKFGVPFCRLVEYDGRLCMLRRDEADPNILDVYNLWILQEHGWVKQHTFALYKIHWNYVPWVIIRNGEILSMKEKNKRNFLYSYNLQSRVRKKIEIHGLPSRCFRLLNHSESLISLKNIMNSELVQ